MPGKQKVLRAGERRSLGSWVAGWQPLGVWAVFRQIGVCTISSGQRASALPAQGAAASPELLQRC